MAKTKLFTIFMAASMALSGAGITANAQKVSQAAKEMATEKVSSDATKEAKVLKKEGWKVAPGALPLERQLERAYGLQYEFNEEGQPKYIFGEGMSTAESYDVAKMQATEMAKQNIASKIESELTAEIKTTLSNEQISSEEATSLIEILQGSRTVITQSMGTLSPITEVYRLKKKNTEVLLRVAYNSEMIKKKAKEIVRKKAKERGEKLHQNFEGYELGNH